MTSRVRKDAIWVSALLLAAAAIAPPLMHRIEEKRLAGCKENLKTIATATEMYSTGEPCRYPKSLSILTPAYVPQIPSCPSAGIDTYSSGFQRATSPDAFTLCCVGHNHALLGIPPNYPQYFNTSGLVER